MEGINIGRDSLVDGPKAPLIPTPTFMEGTKEMILKGPLNILLMAAPVGMISYWCKGPEALTFIFSLLAIAPLAERLGFVTEQLAMHTNETVGGLLNATFGNATELIVAITALTKKLYRLVQLSLLGSVLSNLLLVLGCAFWLGGYYHKTQYFNKVSSQVNMTILIVSTMSILFPNILAASDEETNLGKLGFSRFISFLLLIMYGGFLYFQVCKLCTASITIFSWLIYLFVLLVCSCYHIVIYTKIQWIPLRSSKADRQRW